MESFSSCTDGILFVVDSVDTERMEEAKMELMRTAKCPDNQVSFDLKLKIRAPICGTLISFNWFQGVPVLILANKQDLPSACCPKQLENLLGLHELHHPISNLSSTYTSTSTGNIAGFATSNQSYTDHGTASLTDVNKDTDNSHVRSSDHFQLDSKNTSSHADSKCKGSSSPAALSNPQQQLTVKHSNLNVKGWYIQPACAITGEGLQEGLDALYDMILKRRKISKSHKKNKR